jgi:1-acyl-sn-glycerol-3-phosphate acyltransferase
MKYKFRKASTIFNRFLKATLGNYLRYLFGYRIFNEQITALKPPYIVIANHTNFWDPFLLSMCIPYPVHFVTSDAYFRNPVLRFLLRYVGAIPKTKSVSDPMTIKYILSVAKSGGVIGIFAEGRRNWDGTTLPLLYPTAKLIGSLKIPVVSVLFEGACLSMPRWARYTRRGELTMTCRRVFGSDDLKELPPDEIYSGITSCLAHDEYAWQRGRMVPYKGRSLAERLELFLFLCPECKSAVHMKSHDDIFHCTNCNYAVRYDEYGFFKPVSGRLHFDALREWNLWQLGVLEEEIHAKSRLPEAGPLLADGNAAAYRGGKSQPLKFLHTGELRLYPGRIVFKSNEGEDYSFEMPGIYGENVQFNDQIEFYYEKALYRFGGYDGPISAYKWARALEILKAGNNK